MAHQNKILQDICNVFNMLHDGGIEEWQGDTDLLTLKISCTYLAELIHQDYTFFFVELRSIKKLSFDPWWNDSGHPELLFTAIEQVFSGADGIMSAEITEDYVTITSDHYGGKPYSGGNLLLACEEITVYDEGKKQMMPGELEAICKQYWDKFRNT